MNEDNNCTLSESKKNVKTSQSNSDDVRTSESENTAGEPSTSRALNAENLSFKESNQEVRKYPHSLNKEISELTEDESSVSNCEHGKKYVHTPFLMNENSKLNDFNKKTVNQECISIFINNNPSMNESNSNYMNDVTSIAVGELMEVNLNELYGSTRSGKAEIHKELSFNELYKKEEQSWKELISRRVSNQLCVQIEERESNPQNNSLHSLDELSEALKSLKQKELWNTSKLVRGSVESFVSVIGCSQDIGVSTDPHTVFSRNPRTNEIVVGRSSTDDRSNQPPPPYYDFDNNRNYAHQQTINTTPVYQVRAYAPVDTSRAPPYRRNDPGIPLNLFEDKMIRNQFIKKVYSILTVQLFFTFGITALCIFQTNVRRFVLRYGLILWIISLCVLLAMFITLICSQTARRTSPLNFILLAIFTIAMTTLVALISCTYSTYIVLLTFAVTAMVCLIVTFLACLPCIDITGMGIYLFVAGIVVMIYGVIAVIVTLVTGSNITYLIYCWIATVLFSMYLMYDTQQILGGKRVELSPEEYILGVITLYMDIINIFLHILYICGNR